MIYIDTSSLLKLVLPDHLSVAVEDAIALEETVVVTPLVELEAQVQLRGSRLGGSLSSARLRHAREQLSRNLARSPFFLRPFSGTLFATALKQHETTELHCRSLDRLHLAAMSELGVTRLMTHDIRQKAAAAELGYEVVSPGL